VGRNPVLPRPGLATVLHAFDGAIPREARVPVPYEQIARSHMSHLKTELIVFSM